MTPALPSSLPPLARLAIARKVVDGDTVAVDFDAGRGELSFETRPATTAAAK